MQSICSNAILFSGTSHPTLTAEVAGILNIPVGKIINERFPDGEIHLQIMENVRGRDTFAFQSVARDPNNYLLELLIMIDALKRASAKSITAVLPYFGYCRQDRKDKPRVPITAKLVANMLADAGATHVLTVDLHTGQVQGFFDIPVDHLIARPVLVDAFLKNHKGQVVVATPDLGSTKLARGYAKQLNAEIVVLDKERYSSTEVDIVSVIGDIKGKDVLLADDLCSTAGTLVSAAKACQEKGAKRIFGAVTHGLLVGDAVAAIEQSPLEALYISNTVPATQSILDCKKIRIASVAVLLAQAIECILSNESLSSLNDN